MPSNGQFGFSVLVGGKALPEYPHPSDNTRVLVESILWSPVTYWLTIKEFCKASDEIESQKWPVTPYKIKVFAEPEPTCKKYYYRVFVDGIKVGGVWLRNGESKVLDGFPEEDGSYREFLFSLPRFANDEADRLTENRGHGVGRIEVICYEAFSYLTKRPHLKHSRVVDFSQANKKDVCTITKMEYTMATTRVGRLVKDGKPCDIPEVKKEGLRDAKPYDRPVAKKELEQVKPEERKTWKIGNELQKIDVEYHMTQTLIDWGVKLIRPEPEDGEKHHIE